MDWGSVIGAVADVAAPAAAVVAAGLAAVALLLSRSDQARRDAAGLHAVVSSDWHQSLGAKSSSGDVDGPLVVKVANASLHPYYDVVVSMWLPSRGQRFAAYADVLSPGTARHGALVSIGACDTTSMTSDTLVETTFVDSQGKAWARDSTGRLRRRRGAFIGYRWRARKLNDRPHRGATLHRIGERAERGDDGAEWHVLRDRQGHPVEIEPLGRSTNDHA